MFSKHLDAGHTRLSRQSNNLRAERKEERLARRARVVGDAVSNQTPIGRIHHGVDILVSLLNAATRSILCVKYGGEHKQF